MTKSEQTAPELLSFLDTFVTRLNVIANNPNGDDAVIVRAEDLCNMVQLWQRLQPNLSTLLAENARLTKELAEAKEAAHYANGVADLAMKHRDAAEDARDAGNSALGEKNIIIENLEDEIRKLKAENDGIAAQNDDWQRLATTKEWK